MLKKYLNKKIEVTIDRPINTAHPKHKNIIYKLNYGYIKNTVSGDGEEIDVYLLEEEKPVETVLAKVIAIIHRFNDCEDKLVAVPLNSKIKYTKEMIYNLVSFQEKYFESEIIM